MSSLTNCSPTTNCSSITNCLQQITDLFEKYKDNPYMLQRVNNHILNYLPNTLINEWTNYEKRVDRQNFLTNEQQIFIQVFLSKKNLNVCKLNYLNLPLKWQKAPRK